MYPSAAIVFRVQASLTVHPSPKVISEKSAFPASQREQPNG
jgi:hypothetical protein